MSLNALLNGAYDTVAGAPVSPTAGLSVTVNNSALWPDPATVGPYPITFAPTGSGYTNANGERAMVTAKAAAVLTIVRGIEGSTPRSVIVGDQIFLATGAQDLYSAYGHFGRNLLHNPGFWLAQRQLGAEGTYTTRTDNTYGADRWKVLTQTGATQYERGSGAASGFRSLYTGQLKNTSGGSQRFGMIQFVEYQDVKPYRGETMRFDFIADCISSTQTIRYAIIEWAGTADAPTTDVVNDWTSGTYTPGNFFIATTTSITATGSLSCVINTPTLCSLRGTLSAGVNNVAVMVWTEAAQVNNFEWSISDCCLALDAISVPHTPRPLAQELAICQRFYQGYTLPPVRGVVTAAGTAGRCGFVLPVQMRVAPTLGLPVAIPIYDGVATSNLGFAAGYSRVDRVELDLNGGAGLTANRPACGYDDGTTTLKLTLDADF